jgi:hypothetical protein
MQQILKQAIEQMVRLGNELNWNPPMDHEYVNALNELRALRDATQHSVQRTADDDPQPGTVDYMSAVTNKDADADRRR